MDTTSMLARVGRPGRRRDGRGAALAGRRSDTGLRRRARHSARQAAGRRADAQDADARRAGARRQTPVAAPGLNVNAFATGLEHPRWIEVLPNGDVLVAESMSIPGSRSSRSSTTPSATTLARRRAREASPNRITRLRDANGDGVAETTSPSWRGCSQPFGMALVGDTFYVGNTDGVWPSRSTAPPGASPARAASSSTSSPVATGRAACSRARTAEALCRRRFARPTSATAAWRTRIGRAAVYELDLAAGTSRIFAIGLRNPVGLAWRAVHGRPVDRRQRARRARRRDAARTT